MFQPDFPLAPPYDGALNDGWGPGSVVSRLLQRAARIRLADVVSVLGALLCVAAGGLLLAKGSIAWAALLFPLGASCDIFDGALARRSRRGAVCSGAFVDSLCDKIGEAVLMLGALVYIHDDTTRFVLVVSYVLACLTSYIKAAAGEHGLRIAWPEAKVFGRTGRVAVLSVTLALAAALPEQDYWVFLSGAATLVAFNASSFLWRLLRVARQAHQHTV